MQLNGLQLLSTFFLEFHIYCNPFKKSAYNFENWLPLNQAKPINESILRPAQEDNPKEKTTI